MTEEPKPTFTLGPYKSEYDIPPDDWCFWHGYEPVPEPGFYKMCLECCHGFLTKEELLEAERKVVEGLNQCWPESKVEPTTDPDNVFCCPMCAHSW